MKKRTFQCLLFFVLVVLAGEMAAQDTVKANLTFEEAIELTFQQSHVVKQSNYLKDQKEQDLKAANGLRYPNIGLSANYVYMEEDLHLDLTPVRDAITPLYEGLSNYGVFSGLTSSGVTLSDEMSTAYMRDQYAQALTSIESAEWDKMIQKQQFATVNLTATLPIYTGGKINAKRNAAKLGVEEANLESESKLNQLTTELVERYFGLCLARQAEEVRKEVLQAMQEHMDDATKMKEEGMIANAELLHAKVYYSEAERELKKAERLSKITNRALINTLSDSSYREVYPISNLFYMDEIESMDYFLEEALKNNPSLKKVASKKSLAKVGLKVQTGNYLPSVAIMGTYDLWNYDLSSYVPDWMVGVGLKWTIFDGFARERNRKSAKLKVVQVEEFEQKASKDVQTGVEKYYQELQMSLEQIKELEDAQEFTEEYFRVRQKAFHEGMATSTDVVDANLALVKVKIEKLEAAYQFDVSLSKLLEISGLSRKFTEYQTSPKAKTETFDN